MEFRNMRALSSALSSALASLWWPQPRALGFLNPIDPSVSLSNLYVEHIISRKFSRHLTHATMLTSRSMMYLYWCWHTCSPALFSCNDGEDDPILSINMLLFILGDDCYIYYVYRTDPNCNSAWTMQQHWESRGQYLSILFGETAEGDDCLLMKLLLL